MTPQFVRKATPEDRAFLAWTILTATRSHLSKGWFDICLNRPESDCLKFLAELTTVTIHSPWHYSRFLVAGEDASNPIAAVGAGPYPDAYNECGFALLTCMKRLGMDRDERQAFQNRGSYLLLCAFPPDKGSLVMEIGATKPGARSRGYVSLLLNCAMAEGRSQGLKKAETSCFIGNHASERAITRTGFSFHGEKRHPDFEAIAGVPGIRRFVRDL